MKKRIAPLAVFWVVIALLPGCASAPVLDGFEDTDGIVEGHIREAYYEKTWNTVRAVLAERGELTEESLVAGRMEADIDGSHVVVKLTQTDIREGILRIRSYDWAGGSNGALALQIYNDVLERL